MRKSVPALLAIVALAGACVIQQPVIKPLDVKTLTQTIQTPVKAHLKDGSTVIYGYGVARRGDAIITPGVRYLLGSSTAIPANVIPLDSIVGMEMYSRNVNVPGSVALSLVGTAAAVLGTAVAAVAILGSCPTIYADSAGTELLQAETFSYSIAPLLEQRDVDRLRLTPTADGRVVLRVRNEMLETHYINSLELIEVKHSQNEEVMPDQSGLPIAVANARVTASFVDRSGRNVTGMLRNTDDKLFSTVETRLAGVTAQDLEDYIDITVAAPTANDSVAVVLDMRNSLLNTVLLYDHILGAPGLKSLDYTGKDLENISTAIDMGRWYAANMGMRVSILDGDKYRRITRIADAGPIAFHRSAVLVPVIRANDGMVHVRLSFTADNWRIDQITVASDWHRPASRTIPVSRVAVSNPDQTKSSVAALSQPDESYVITSPGQAFTAEFDVGQGNNAERTWFLASQGYYSEWVRGDWIKNATGKPFTPTNDVLVDAIRGWRAKQKSMETAFYTQRIAAR